MRLVFLLVFFIPLFSVAQSLHQQPDAAQIKLKLKKLNFLGAVLYVAAHPDDENTNIIAYLSNHHLAATGYLSLTRGDGGQNLIGPETRETLGVIRTQELLAARRIDGGQQFFTRAIDFGFSKSADEAISMWGKEAILSDAVKIIRQFQPDVIITRFPADERAGHGHHTASAVVAVEAFDLAAKSTVFPDQVKELGTWKVKRLYTNTGRWWNTTINESTPGIITLNVGGYNSLLGKSYSEISALSSSQHKSQGWGRKGQRGYLPEFLEYVKGERAVKNIFDGIDTTWNRVPGGMKIQALISRAQNEFNAENPANLVPLLIKIRNEISALGNHVWRNRKLRETEQLIENCLGLFVGITAVHPQSSPGEMVRSSIEIVNRSSSDIQLQGIQSRGLDWDTTFSTSLKNNIPIVVPVHAPIPMDAEYSDPYWLKWPHTIGTYTVKDADKVGLPQREPAITFEFDFRVGAEKLKVIRPIIYTWVDPVKGELWRPFEIVPPVTLNLSENVLIFSTPEARQITVSLKSLTDRTLKGTAKLELPEGWRSEPPTLSFELSRRGAEQSKSISIHPSAVEKQGILKAVVSMDGKQYNQSLRVISFDHFPMQTLLPPAQINVVRLDLKKEGNVVGYIEGAGDEVPSALRNMGYEVLEMKNDDITLPNLKRMDAVVLGIRALNTNDRAPFFMPEVLEYARQGGTVVVQYNTNSKMATEQISPYPLIIGRDRVTEENSEIKILKPGHRVLNIPNKITMSDFNGWVQERGLYFPSQWDGQYEAILSMQDHGEPVKDGSLLIANYGKGYYVYTAISFFRQLPEGVPGAYKLFANILSLGKNNTHTGKP